MSKAYRVYDLTAFYNENNNLSELIPNLKGLKNATWQVEEGENNKNLHWQCHLHFERPVRGNGILKQLNLKKNEAHYTNIIPKEKNESTKLAILKHEKYCRKEKSRIKGPWFYPSNIIKIELDSCNCNNEKLNENDKNYIARTKLNIKQRQVFIDYENNPTVKIEYTLQGKNVTVENIKIKGGKLSV